MRYDKELQAAGKFFVATIQGEDGRKGRELIKRLQENVTMELTLRVGWSNDGLRARVGTTDWPGTEEWPIFDVHASLLLADSTPTRHHSSANPPSDRHGKSDAAPESISKVGKAEC